jgi:hypothetical protein
MGAQMNIKNAEAHALATELAQQEGTSVTQVVLEALRARKRQRSREERFNRAMEIARDMRARMSPETLALDVDDYLYDDNGLPK